MILFKSGALHIFTLFLVVILILLWEIGEIQSKEIAKRGIMDNINNGIRFAGQIFGINNAADVANLVAKAFAPKTFQKPEYSANNLNTAETLNTGETEQSYSIYQNAKQSENEDTEPTPLNTGFVIANMLKLMGLDTAKLGALALNIIIVIAQMIGSTFTQNQSSKIHSPEQHLDLDSGRQSKISDPINDYKSNISDTDKLKPGSPFDWILENPSEELKKLLQQIRDEKLPEYFISQINEIEKESGEGDCIKILICKIQPFFWSMQKQVIKRIDGIQNEENESENDNRTDVFYKYLPTLNDFKKHGDLCEKKFPKCNFYVRSR
ncbi:uncharacterized protein LOC129611424 [Condylostylus longicornis]|uniref:uncharacterized protein LOC129611424 n=1 Tax=Condylostylus longicornis TaxID=2530218 RepID=UPI00244E0073|nr:uncharacterized protein LOC129611424 [Condylostylus longicornis]